MKRIGAIGLVLLGVALAGFGLLFLVGSAGKGYRIGIALASMLLGAISSGVGARWVKQAAALSPARIEAEILALAKREDGEVSEDEVRALLGERWEAAQDLLAKLCYRGSCEKRSDETRTFFVFPDLQARLTVRRCQYCDAELPVGEDVAKCRSCGGTLETAVKRVGVTEGAYSMDE